MSKIIGLLLSIDVSRHRKQILRSSKLEVFLSLNSYEVREIAAHLVYLTFSVIFLSVIFYPCHSVRHFPVCQFPVLQFQSTPKFLQV